MKPWNEMLLEVWSWLRPSCRPALVTRVRKTHPAPADLPLGRMVLVKDGDLEKAACFLCPGGCGQKIVLSLSATHRPRWHVELDWLRRPTVEPSIRQLNECGCHFWVRRGSINWCNDSGGRPPADTKDRT